MPTELHLHWSPDDQKEPSHQERLRQKEDHVPKALDHLQLVVVVRSHQGQPQYAVEDHLDDRT
jgi:hypothetical protein